MNSSIDTSCQSCPKKNSPSAFRRKPSILEGCPGSGPSDIDRTSPCSSHSASSRASGSDIPCRCGPWVVPLPAAHASRAPSSPSPRPARWRSSTRWASRRSSPRWGQVALAGRDAELRDVGDPELVGGGRGEVVGAVLPQAGVLRAPRISRPRRSWVPAPAPRQRRPRGASPSLPCAPVLAAILTPGLALTALRTLL